MCLLNYVKKRFFVYSSNKICKCSLPEQLKTTELKWPLNHAQLSVKCINKIQFNFTLTKKGVGGSRRDVPRLFCSFLWLSHTECQSVSCTKYSLYPHPSLSLSFSLQLVPPHVSGPSAPAGWSRSSSERAQCHTQHSHLHLCPAVTPRKASRLGLYQNKDQPERSLGPSTIMQAVRYSDFTGIERCCYTRNVKHLQWLNYIAQILNEKKTLARTKCPSNIWLKCSKMH